MSWIDDLLDGLGSTAGSQTMISGEGGSSSGSSDTAVTTGIPPWQDTRPAIGVDDGSFLGLG